MLDVRRAAPADYAEIAELLNEVIAAGGTPAFTDPVSRAGIADWVAEGGPRAAWFVARDDAFALMGFQWIEPHHSLADVAEIATFARRGKTGLGIGSALFEATAKAGRDLGYAWINANIRADNEGGLIYYQSRGFVDYGRIEGYELGDGTRVDKILKRYDLD